MTNYTDIFNIFLNKISDVKLLDMDDNDINQMLTSWMTSAISKMKKCKSDLSSRDDKIQEFNSDLLDIEKEIIATGMVTEWLAPQLNSTLCTSQFFGTKEEKFYAQANQLEKLQTLSEKNRIEARKLARDYSYQTFINENLS